MCSFKGMRLAGSTLAGWLLVASLAAGCVEYNPGQGAGYDAPPGPEEVPDGWILEEFTGGGDSSASVLVVGDTSGSMEQELRTMGDTITPFVERLATHVDTWTLAAITDGSGCVVDGVLTAETNNYADKFADAITTEAGNDSEAEQGLRNVLQVLENTDRRCNEGLLLGGLLHIVFVADENDESPGYDESPDYWKEWVEEIGEAYGDPSKVVMSAVAGPTPTGCAGADPGFGYDGAVRATGGEFLSICDDWASEIDLLADATAMRSTFPLGDLPIVETLQVWVNDREMISGTDYTYDPQTNIVTLEEPSGPGDRVAILYQPAGG